MSRIPPEMHARVLDLACQITNAVLADDAALSASHYLSLVAYYQAQTDAGLGHPFLTETVADFTEDPVTALRYYQLALQQAEESGAPEPTQTILLAMGTRWLELGQWEQAEACWQAGHREAIRQNDPVTLEEAAQLLKAHCPAPPPGEPDRTQPPGAAS